MSHKNLKGRENPFRRAELRRAPHQDAGPQENIQSTEEETEQVESATNVDVGRIRNSDKEFSFIHHMQLFDYFTFVLRQKSSNVEFTEQEKSIAQNYMSVCHATLGGCGCTQDSRVRVAMESYKTLVLAEEGTHQRTLMEKVKENLGTESLIFLLDGKQVARF